MQRRNFFKLNQGCDPKTCTNCSCESCNNNKLGQATIAPTMQPSISQTTVPTTTPTRPTTITATQAPTTTPTIYGQPADTTSVPTSTEAGAVPKGLSTIQAVLVTGFLIGVFKFVMDSRGKKLKLG